jgi:alpha-glucoside transport system substrate-binding protein
MKTSRNTVTAALLGLSMLAAACGSDGTDAGEDTGTTEGSGEGASVEVGDSILDGAIPCEDQYAGKSVSIFSPVRNSENDTPVTDLVNAYAPLVECTGVEIVWEGTDQFETEINVRLEGGNAPDVIDYPQPGLMAQHARKGQIQPLPDDVAAPLETDYIEGWAGYSTVDGVAYALPGRSNIKSLVWYSPSAFADAGYEVPASLDDLRALSDQIVEDGGVPWCLGAESGVATGWILTDWMEDFMLRTHGEEVYDQWVNHEIPFNDPQVAEVAEEVGSYVKNPDYLGGENKVKAIATTKFQDGGLPILSGECFMHRQASFYSALWPEGTEIGEEGDINVFYLPSPADGPAYMLGAGDVIAAGTDKPESFDVVRYSGSLEYMSEIVNTRGELVPHLELDVTTIEDPFIRRLSELQLEADVFRFDASDLMPGAVGSGTFWTEATAWIVGGDTETFLDNVEDSWPAS